MSNPIGDGWSVRRALPDEPEAAAVLRRYLGEMISRYYGRDTDDAEIDKHLREGHDSEDLAPPTGLLLLAYRQGVCVGCVGLRGFEAAATETEAEPVELTRMFVAPEARGEGAAALLLAEAERHARELGARVIRLNTRGDLVEARALYAKHGYAEIPKFGDDPFADHWFEKTVAA